MVTEVLLMTDVKNLGDTGAVVKVSDGYARNFLFPQKLAAPVSAGMQRRLAKLQAEREASRKLAVDAARDLAAKLKEASCTLVVKASSEEHLYGSVAAADIAEALAKQGFNVDKSCIYLETPIKKLGVFDVMVKLHADVETTVRVWVVKE